MESAGKERMVRGPMRKIRLHTIQWGAVGIDCPCQEEGSTGELPDDVPDAEPDGENIGSIQYHRAASIVMPNERGQHPIQLGPVLASASGELFLSAKVASRL